VTVAEYRQFYQEFFGTPCEYSKEYSPTGEHPMNGVTWYQAAAYCNWLSQKEGIDKDQWCYKPNAKGKYDEGMTMAENYLQLEGYRLPTEAEWEFGCRAGALTSRPYGETEELLPRYAWYLMNSTGNHTLPVGSLMPNDLGLFDMLGNVDEWCLDRFADFPPEKPGRAREDQEAMMDITGGIQKLDNRVLRGGSFYALPRYVRSANRYRAGPNNRNNDRVGFRVARTVACTGHLLYPDAATSQKR
jgi:formylglycine-generating enzyme required for sulfatase activity